MISAKVSSEQGVECEINGMSVLAISSIDLLNLDAATSATANDPPDQQGNIWLTSIEVTSNQQLIPIKTNLLPTCQAVLQELKTSPYDHVFVIQISNCRFQEDFLLELEKLARCTVCSRQDVSIASNAYAYTTLLFRRGVTLHMSKTGEELQVLIAAENEKEKEDNIILQGHVHTGVDCTMSTYNTTSSSSTTVQVQ
jgi:hypothetical protein